MKMKGERILSEKNVKVLPKIMSSYTKENRVAGIQTEVATVMWGTNRGVGVEEVQRFLVQ